jgi:hypothetical protein
VEGQALTPCLPVGALQHRGGQARPLSTAAVRARRSRLRRKIGKIVVPIEIAEFEVLGALLDRRRLTEEGSRSRAIVGAALAQIVAEWAAKNRL